MKGANKDDKIYVAQKVNVRVQCFDLHSYASTDYVTKMFLLVRSSVRSKTTVVFCAQSRPKKRTKTYNKELCEVSSSFPSINYNGYMLVKNSGLDRIQTHDHCDNSICVIISLRSCVRWFMFFFCFFFKVLFSQLSTLMIIHVLTSLCSSNSRTVIYSLSLAFRDICAA